MRRPGAAVRAGLLVLGLATLGGCATLGPRSAPNLQDVDKLVASHRYGEALDALSRVPPSAADYAKARARMAAVRREMAHYRTGLLKKVEARETAGDIKGALQTLQQGARDLPPDKTLRQTRQRLEREQTHRLQILDQRMHLARARYLLRQLELYRESLQLRSPSYAARWRKQRTQDELKDLHGHLLDCGRAAMARHDMDLAADCLHAAQRIDDTPPVQAALKELQGVRETQARAARERIRQQQAASERARTKRRQAALEGELNGALNRGDLQQARAALRKLRQVSGSSSRLKELTQAVDEAIAAKVKELLRRGANLYRQGDIVRARDTWREALKLDPDNVDAQARVERADRVLEKLHQLKQDQPPAGPGRVSPAPPPAD